MENQQTITSLAGEEVTSYVNKKTRQVIRVTYNAVADDPRKAYPECKACLWTFDSRFASPDAPQGYNGAAKSFDEALGCVLGFSKENYEEQLNAIRSECTASNSVQQFFDKIKKLAADKGIWLEPISLYFFNIDPNIINLVLCVLDDDDAVGFAWAKYSDIKEEYLSTWEEMTEDELKSYTDHITGYIYAMEYRADDSKQRYHNGYLTYDDLVCLYDPHDKAEVLDIAKEELLCDFDINLDDWVEAKPVKKVVYVTSE